MAKYKIQQVSTVGKTQDAMQRKLREKKALEKAEELTKNKASKSKRKQ